MRRQSTNAGNSPLAAQLSRELEGEVLFDAFSRGRYSTDASMYQIQPIGVVVPRHKDDVLCAIQIAAQHGVPVLPRGAGTSQAGQTVGEALVIDDGGPRTLYQWQGEQRRASCVFEHIYFARPSEGKEELFWKE